MTDKAQQIKRGRPSGYTDALAAEIVDRITQGETLADICRDDHMPGYRTVYDWERARPDFSANITRARLYGYDQIANATRRVARGDPGYSRGDVQRDKLIVETDLKLLAKWDKRYGEKVQTEVTGPDGGAIQTETKLDLTGLTADQLRALASIKVTE
jgi:hypothetical protein